MVPFYTKYVCPEEFGISDLIATYAALIAGVVTCQIQDAIFIFPKDKDHRKQAAYFTSGLKFLACSYIGAAAVFLAVYLILESTFFLHSYCWYIYIHVILASCQGYVQQFSRSIDKMVAYAMSGVFSTIGQVVSALLIIPIYKSGIAMISCLYIGFAAGTLSVVIQAKIWKYIVRKTSFHFDFLPMIRYAIPLIPTTIMWWAIPSLNRPLLEKHASLAAIGLYAVGCKIPNIIHVGWSIVGNAWQISVLEELHKEDFSIFFHQFFDLLEFGLCCAVLLITVFSYDIMRVFVAPEYLDSYIIMPLLAGGAMFSLLAGSIGAVFAAAKKSKFFLYSSLGAIMAIVVLNFLLIPKWGLIGAALANMLTLMIEFFIRICFVRKIIPFSMGVSKIMTGICPLICLVAFYLIESQPMQVSLYCASALILAFFLAIKMKTMIRCFMKFRHR